MSQYTDLFEDPGRPLPPREARPYTDLFDDTARPNAALAVQAAASASPDKAAEALAIARRYSLPPAVAQQFAEDYKARAKTEDARATFDKAPRLGSWIAEKPDRAQVAHDDLENLGNLEKTIGGMVSYTLGARPDGGLPSDISKAVRSLLAGAGPGFGAAAYGTGAAPFGLADQALQALDDAAAALTGTPRRQIVGTPGPESFLLGLQSQAKADAARLAGADPNAGFVERSIMSGLQSAGQNLVTLPIGFAQGGTNAMLGTMGALTFGDTYGRSREKLDPAKAFVFGAQDAAAEVITEKYLGAVGLLGDAKAGMGAAKIFMRDIAREIPGEIGATLWQNFNEWANLNPEKSVSEFLAEQPEAIAQTIIATIVGAGVQTGSIRGVQKVLGDGARREAQAAQAEQAALQFETLTKIAEASKLKGRDAETFREFVAQAADENGDAPTELFIDGQQLLNTLNQSGTTREELAAVAPVVAAQLEAAAAGADVRIPVSEFLSAGEAVTAPLIDHLRTSPDAMTRAEAQEFLKTEGDRIQKDVEAELSRADDQATFRESIAGVQKTFQAELDAAKRFTPDVNKAYSSLLANYYGATAARLDITPDELLQRYGLRVRSDAGGGAQTLDQAPIDTTEFRNWFSESKVVDAEGKPLVVYHGTREQFEVFDYSKIGQQGRSEGAGFYFTNNKDVASGYGRPLEVFLSIRKPLAYDAPGFSKAVVQKIVKRVAELEAQAEDGDIADGFLANFGDVRSEGLQAVVREAAGMIAADETALDQLSGIVGSGVNPKFVNQATRDVTGHDGVVADGFSNAGGGDNRIFVAFFPEQIKSAGNRGTFDPADPNILNQSAFHGTPYRGIDKFSTDFIGTGEGNQAYGYGLYFAGLKDVAEYYRRALSGDGSRTFVKDGATLENTIDLMEAYYKPGRLVRGYGGTDKVLKFERNDRGGWGVQVVGVKANGEEMRSERPRWHTTQPDANNLREVLEADGWKASKPGQVYEVDIPEDSEMLLWDKPLSEQSPKVMETLAPFIERHKENQRKIMSAFPAAEVEREIAAGLKALTGQGVYEQAGYMEGGGDRSASEYLMGLGVKGIKYLDGLSRTAKAGSHNYVVFSGDDVAIRQALYQGGKDPRAQLSFAPDITASPSVISLLAGADLSSFIHESGHFFLEVQGDLARRIQQQIDSGASVSEQERGIVADMGRLLQWFGVTGSPELSAMDTWSTMTLDERREMHEKFARGFEAYTFEGVAPSIELQGLFTRFRSWLVQVYHTLRSLNVTLTDDVRAVMGRMLATDQAIEEAEAQRNMGPLFRDAEKAGMTLEEFNAYQAIAGKATDAAVQALQLRGMKDMKWLSRARDKALKARQAEAEELRREIRAEVRMEVYAEPVYRAWQYLTGKGGEDGPAGKLSTKDMQERYGPGEASEWRTLSRLRMTNEDGRNVDIVAEDLGFDSGDAMVKALVAAVPPSQAIEARTDQRMLEMFGDITSPEALARAADEAVHNEARAKFIASELKALQEAGTVRADAGKSRNGRRMSVDVMAKAAREYAQQIVGRLRVRDIRPAQYASAEARSARLAEKAFSSGKTAEAAMHKRNQLVNNHATRAAYAAQDEVASAVRYLRRFDKPVKSIDRGYQDQIDQLLERYDLKPASLKEIDRRKSFGAWIAEQQAAGNEPDVPEHLLNEAGRQSYKDMTVEELRGLVDTVKQIEHLGRLKNRLLLARDKRDFDAIADEMAATIVKYGGAVRPVELEGAKGVKPWLEGVAAQHRKLASLFRQMDGGKDDGPMFERIGRAMNERGTMEDVMVEKATVALADLYAPLMKLRGGVTGARSKMFIKEINASLTRGGRLAVALNWGNEQNRQRIRDGDKWSDAQVQAILKTLTATELEFVNGVWRYIDTYWEDIAAKEERLTGVAPEKVASEPFVVTSADGVEVPMRGGYYPLKYDSDRSDRAEQQEAAQVAKEMMQGAFTKATTRRGHTKERLQEVKRPVRKDLNVITQHVTQVVHDLAWHEWLIDTNKLLADDRIVQAIRDHYGPKVLKTMRDGVMGIATADVVPQTDIDKALLLLRSNVTRATMGASLTTAFLQPFGLTQSVVRLGGGKGPIEGAKWMLRGMRRWGGEAARMESTLSWIHDKSDFMRLRAKTFNRELREIRGAVDGKSKTMQVVDGGLFWMMQKMQTVADVPTWVGQYEKTMAEGPAEDTDAARLELEDKAVAMADRAVLEAQGGGSTKDMAEVQRKHPMLTQFYSYFSVTLNLTAESTASTDFKNPRAVAGWLGDMALLMVIPAILPSLLLFLLKGGGGDDEDEASMAKRIAQWQLGYLLGSVVGLRELNGAASGFDYAGPPVGRVVADIGKAGKQTVQGDIDEPAVMAYVNLIGTAFGIPVIQALRSYKGWKAWDEGQEGAGPQSVLFGPPPKN